MALSSAPAAESVAPDGIERAAEAAAAPHETRNLLILALHSIVFRIGWTFKQESIIMSVFLDAIAGQAWVRGMLPLLSRVGQSLPPLWWANPLRQMPSKKRALAWLSVVVGLPYLVLSGVWWSIDGERKTWLPTLFLALYLAFFIFYGLQQLSLATVQGKLIRPARRGRLLWLGQLIGVFPVVALMAWLMPRWLHQPNVGFIYIFFFAGLAFVLAGLTTGLLAEPAGGVTTDSSARRSGWENLSGTLRETGRVLHDDGNLRLLILISILFSGASLLAPHFQAFARVRFGLSKPDMAALLPTWVIIQTVSVSSFSLALGPLADWRGNRLTLRLLIFGTAITPLVAMATTLLPDELGPALYWIVYIPQGLTPLLIPLLTNYALEICHPADHPRYLSTLTVCLAVPYFFSPLLGGLIDLTNYETVFLAATALLAASGILTFWLHEPRRGDPDAVNKQAPADRRETLRETTDN